MNNLQELENYIQERYDNEVMIFLNPDYYSAFIGVSEDNRAIYDIRKMEEYLIRQGVASEDAMDFICYNTLRALPYAREKAPIIMYPV